MVHRLLPFPEMPAIDRILLGTDFSPTSNKALEFTGEIARRLDAEVVLLHVNEPPEIAPLPDDAAQRRERARGELDRSRRELEDANVRVRVLLRPGDPAGEILRMATVHDARVIVIGTHGATAATALLLGSVADRVVRHAAVPVLVIPDDVREPAVPRKQGSARRRGAAA